MSKVKELRRKNNIKLNEMAVLLEMSTANYSKKENGLVKFSLIEAKKISDLFHMQIEDIFFEKKDS
ncbi:MAG: XRE family transcriptional regulator [Clostridium sp.]|uniref:helix-turn-helix transcriptional regulator n=1 Tax=Intestinibacter bartlettii TaxID=261299 RepID=UPI000D78E517|nr:helix-turn-helix domain-containing protein [Intestinibacter bartlettii]MDU2694226.1 helix-turn-helix domain-containing protein [Intestinibacter bartlettii]PWM77918.1 MAG: XRE family transcriptional regulator [Clostridium sp.]